MSNGKAESRTTCIVRAPAAGAYGTAPSLNSKQRRRAVNLSTRPLRGAPRVDRTKRDGWGSVKNKSMVASRPTNCLFASQRCPSRESIASQLSSAKQAPGSLSCHGVQVQSATDRVRMYSITLFYLIP